LPVFNKRIGSLTRANTVKRGINNKKRLGKTGNHKRIYPTNLILDKNIKISIFFQENRDYPPKEGVSIFQKRIN